MTALLVRALPHIVLVGVGLWLMAAPAVLGHAGTAAGASDRVAGPSIASIAFLSCFTITRPARWANLVFGAWLLAAPWLLGAPAAATVSDTIAGIATLALAPLGGLDYSRYGGGWATLFRIEDLPGRPGR